MYNQTKGSNEKNRTETVIYTVIGGVICCYFIPSATISIVLGGIVIGCAYGIMDVLQKYQNQEKLNFVEKEKINYFNK